MDVYQRKTGTTRGTGKVHCTRNVIFADHSARTTHAINFVYQPQPSIAVNIRRVTANRVRHSIG